MKPKRAWTGENVNQSVISNVKQKSFLEGKEHKDVPEYLVNENSMCASGFFFLLKETLSYE